MVDEKIVIQPRILCKECKKTIQEEKAQIVFTCNYCGKEIHREEGICGYREARRWVVYNGLRDFCSQKCFIKWLMERDETNFNDGITVPITEEKGKDIYGPEFKVEFYGADAIQFFRYLKGQLKLRS